MPTEGILLKSCLAIRSHQSEAGTQDNWFAARSLEELWSERRSPGTGIIFNDAAGNERGGMAMLDDGSMNLCFDDAKAERNCLVVHLSRENAERR